MYQFDIAATDKAALYADLAHALDALTADEPDAIANMANAAALLWEYLPGLNWAGFYRNVRDELVLGPFQGKAACIRTCSAGVRSCAVTKCSGNGASAPCRSRHSRTAWSDTCSSREVPSGSRTRRV